jgi:site-specific DNA-cytosine methylase
MIADLFAGPGGWDVAAAALGLDVTGIELDDYACATRRAAGLRTVQDDVSAMNPRAFGGVEGLIASPPCQAFSMAGSAAPASDGTPRYPAAQPGDGSRRRHEEHSQGAYRAI